MAIILILADMRSIAASVVIFGCTAVSAGLGSLRPSEGARASSEVGEAECGSEWSGRKADESGQRCRRNSAEVRAVTCASTALGVREADSRAGQSTEAQVSAL